MLFLFAGIVGILGVGLWLFDLLRNRTATVQQTSDSEEKGGSPKKLTAISKGGRKEKKTWAEAHGFDYTKEDAFLSDEWSREAAVDGAIARNVVSGIARGYEMYLVELGGVSVMALRRAVSSDVVVVGRREAHEDTEDLRQVSCIEGFTLYSNDQGATERMLDERVDKAFADMPSAVSVVWEESDWVLVQLERGSTHEDWEALIQPLTLFADATRVLPPRSGATQPVDFTDCDPSRPMPDAPETEEDDSEDAVPVLPVVARKEDPVQLPTRAAAQARGVVEPRSVGSDEVAAIAKGDKPETGRYNGTRVLRDLSQGSTIFEDLTEELGTDPLN
ncbi:Hypothetical protein Cp262_1833 [Corynebacterium pseudotuberculosis]|uniref:hypothetical protein n=1 Tax=Corynebacterium pseudotuberculosis TaxID=1719 RepID=UPI00065E84FC|nr:hypothetical protein [Corynebacterium pseudotuberculosis]AKP09469.2 Hypothetical protein Cp262_1833 [Corynebacterium pseudotuberculosis]